MITPGLKTFESLLFLRDEEAFFLENPHEP